MSMGVESSSMAYSSFCIKQGQAEAENKTSHGLGQAERTKGSPEIAAEEFDAKPKEGEQNQEEAKTLPRSWQSGT